MKITKRTVVLVVFTLFIVVVFFVSLSLLWWRNYSQDSSIVFSGVNFYQQTVTVKTADVSKVVKPFNTFHIKKKYLEDSEFTLQALIGKEVIYTETIKVDPGVNLHTVLLSPQSEVQACFIKANLQSAFYENSKAPLKVESLNTERQVSITTNIASYNESFIYPGLDLKKLPPTTEASKKLTTVLPIACNRLDDSQSIEQIVVKLAERWRAYDPQVQLEMYQQAKEDLQNSPKYTVPPL